MKNAKKIIVFIFAIALVATMVFALGGCRKNEQPCSHEYEEGVCIHCGDADPDVTNPDDVNLKMFGFTYLKESDSYSVRLNYNKLSSNLTELVELMNSTENLVIPSTYNGKPVTAIDDFGFSLHDKEYFENSSGVTFGTSIRQKVTIPASINHIGEGAFASHYFSSIKVEGGNQRYYSDGNCLIDREANAVIAAGQEISIPQGITTIGSYAFSGNSYIANVNIPNSVTTIGDYAFWGCNSISRLVLPDSVTTIGKSAFQGCYGLYSVVTGAGLTSIGNNAFLNCSSLYVVYDNTGLNLELNSTSSENSTVPGDFIVVFPSGSSSPDLTDNGGICHYAKVLVKGDKITYRHDSSYTYILENDFFFTCSRDSNEYRLICYSGIEETVTLPESINGCDYEIYRMKGAVNLIIPDGITNIQASAFSSCKTLKSIVIPDSVTYIGDNAFDNCSSLTSVVIPDSVTSIGDYAFYWCSSLTSVVIPDSVTSIGDGAFCLCYSLQSVVIGNSVTSIGDGAFAYCGSLTDITVDENNKTYKSIDGSLYSKDGKTLIQYATGKPDTTFEIPDGVTTIKDNAFLYCTYLNRVIIPASVTNIEALAFAYTDSIDNIIVDENNQYFKSLDGNLYSKDGKTLVRYATGKSDTTFEIPNSVTSIGDYAFYDCSSLTSVVIPDSVTSIGDYAFAFCYSLTSVVIPDSVTTIGEDAFASCDSLTSVVIGNSVTSIGDYAFAWCYSLQSVVIGNGVTSIGDSAFYNCDSLTSVVIGNSVTTIGDNAFSSCKSLTSVVIGNSVTSIGEGAFAWCDSLTSVVIPDSVTTIGEGAFSSCSSLTSVVIGNSVTTIGEDAFSGCSSLTSVVIGNSVTTIGEDAFYNCNSLTSVVIPDSVTSIGSSAFRFCYRLTSVVIGNSVTSIGKSAFNNCSSITDVYYTGTEESWRYIHIDSLNQDLTNATIHFNYVPEK